MLMLCRNATTIVERTTSTRRDVMSEEPFVKSKVQSGEERDSLRGGHSRAAESESVLLLEFVFVQGILPKGCIYCAGWLSRMRVVKVCCAFVRPSGGLALVQSDLLVKRRADS